MELEKVPAYYTLRHRPSGKFYIGSTGNIHKRIIAHRTALARGSHHNEALSKVFTRWEDFDIQVGYMPDLKDARAAESMMINVFSRLELCCNVPRELIDSPGGGRSAGYRHTEETKEKIRKGNVGKNTREITGERSEEVKAKMIAWRLNPCSIDGVVYPSIKAASHALGLSKELVRHRIVSQLPKYDNWFTVKE